MLQRRSMKNRARLIHNILTRSIAANLNFRTSTCLFRLLFFPLVVPRSSVKTMAHNVQFYFENIFNGMNKEAASIRAKRFLYHYRRKFAEDCLLLNLDFRTMFDLIDEQVTVHGLDHLVEALDRGQGVLAVGSHVGSILLGTVALVGLFRHLVGREGLHIRICSEPDMTAFPALQEMMAEFYRRYHVGVSFIYTHRRKHTVASEIVKALKNRCVVTTNLDVLTGGYSTRSYTLFNGVRVYLPAVVGAAKVVLYSDAVILPWFNTRRHDGGLSLCIEKSIVPAPFEGGRITEDHPACMELCGKLARKLEEWIAGHPEQWIYLDRFHKHLADKIRTKPA
jgi:lauroyl/myristoyl acyltransferase